MEIYLDANATTPVLPLARAAALAVMAEDFGNPSSSHGSGLKARALLAQVRGVARRVLGVQGGQLLFTSGATEGIQTAVLSALSALRRQVAVAGADRPCLLYGATEHKAVPEALRHWNAVLGLDLPIEAIPVGTDGRHDLAWLAEHAPRAGLVCTMAANNETGVVTDLDGIAAVLAGTSALWLVDGVQALGKLPLRLHDRRIDYAPFSGHKLYAPKGIGMLYVREGAPFTPLLAGGGQEGALRAGTENMAAIAALGAVLEALDDATTFADQATLAACRAKLEAALVDAFEGVVFNAPARLCLPTTLNFSVPGISSSALLNLFDAAGLRVSGGSACSASLARPSHVLEAMGLPAWQSAGAVRLSFGAADGPGLIDEACARIRACGEALRSSLQGAAAPAHAEDPLRDLDGATEGATPGAGGEPPGMKMGVGIPADEVEGLLRSKPAPVVVDVRELYEQRVTEALPFATPSKVLSAPLSNILCVLPTWLALPAQTPVLFYCRSGNRSAQAARALRRLGHENAWSLDGGLALWPQAARESADA
ncbi:aminotransferase class V-fold PLP-dependent enzyme [Variovorax sp.]|uniref:aminotransferase class V-fold PLP-dependent enzyme n=1 Tax=Variovorax sp. TaxID=1871043 RepID=UPI002D6D64DE|nr:aminotransferase class V-fold PLP-dependent enzyme [Variovorax sp.]HYP85013.1 aminotransferase class V-fold PLP-dependent enzyme [Variovorax sp.]